MAPELLPVRIDPAHIDQVILNLAVNSRDAMPHGGKLTIETANIDLPLEGADGQPVLKPGPYVMLAVTDTGTGMDAATRSRIFEPFFTTKEQGKGTGLGLAIVYGVVKQNDGEILVYSEPDQGTTFKMYFPAVAAPVEAPPEEVAEPETAPATGAILLVEDEEQVRRLTETMLSRLGYQVIAASSAAEALQWLQAHPEWMDLLLTDVVMPHMGGAELAGAVQSMRPGIKVLFMSGYTDEGIVNQVMLDPATPFIQKPFTAFGLLKKVRDVLRDPGHGV